MTFFSITLAYCLTTISFLQVNLFLIFLVFGMLFQYEAMYVAFGFQHEKPVLVGLLVLLQFICSPYNAVSYVVSMEANYLIASFCNTHLLFSTPSPLYAGSHLSMLHWVPTMYIWSRSAAGGMLGFAFPFVLHCQWEALRYSMGSAYQANTCWV